MRQQINLYYSFLLLFFSPVLSLISSIYLLDWKFRKWILIIIVTLFGSTVKLPQNADGFRHRENVTLHYQNLSFKKFIDESILILQLNPARGTKGDLYIHVVSYVVGGIFQFPELFFVVVAFVFAYFYINSIRKIFEGYDSVKLSWMSVGIFLMFITFRGIDNINTVRTWTAGWMLFYGILSYLQTNKKRYFALILLTPAVHFAFVAIAIPAIFALIFGKFSKLSLIILYFLSFIVTLNTSNIASATEGSDFASKKVNSYYRDTGAEEEGSNTVKSSIEAEEVESPVWYVRYGKRTSHNIVCNLIIFYFIITGFYKSILNKSETGLFCVGIFLVTIANFASFIYAFHNRTLLMAGVFMVAVATSLFLRGALFGNHGKYFRLRKFYISICLIVFLPAIIYSIILYMVYGSAFLLAFPFLDWVIGSDSLSIREFIKHPFS